MPTIKVYGQTDYELKKNTPYTPDNRVKVKHAVKIEATRSQDTPEYRIDDLEEGDVLELTFEDGITRWMSREELEEEFGTSTQSRGADEEEQEEVIIIQPRIQKRGTTRGLVTWTLKFLRVLNLKVDPAEMVLDKVKEKVSETVAKKMAMSLAERFDHKMCHHKGLHKKEKISEQATKDNLVKKIEAGKDQPILVFIHGTFSNCAESFGKLPEPIWKELLQKYNSHVYCFDHPTLSVSPIENALELAKALPAKAKVHLVTFSRGGMIGELLARNSSDSDPFDATDLKIIGKDNKELQKKLEELSKELKKKEFIIERFVRVACPAGGTTLASQRLDRWLELSLNILGKITGADVTLIYGLMTELLLEIKKQSHDTGSMPGLAAMSPVNPLVRILNRPNVKLDADLRVIAGDIEGTGIFGKIAIFFTDLFYQEDHDLVVHTRSMYGGISRNKKAYFYFHKSSGVSHFNYFRNNLTATRLKIALTAKKEEELLKSGFQLISDKIREEAAKRGTTKPARSTRSQISRPICFILPGFMGSTLNVDNTTIWLDLEKIFDQGVDKIAIDAENVVSESLIADTYQGIINYFDATHEVIVFPYDWRLSMMESAKKFREVLREKLGLDSSGKKQDSDKAIRIIAHGSGGMVARLALGQDQEAWNEFKERKGSRLLLLGTPHNGSYAIPRFLLGQDKLINLLNLSTPLLDKKDLVAQFAQYPGMLEQIPFQDRPDLSEITTWDKYFQIAFSGWPFPKTKWAALLKKAAKVQDILKNTPAEPDIVISVHGCAHETPIGIELEKDKHNNQEISFIGNTEGDGKTSHSSSELSRTKSFYIESRSGDLVKEEKLFSSYYDLLHSGDSPRLLTQPIRTRDIADLKFSIGEEKPQMFPTDGSLVRAAMGTSLGKLKQLEKIHKVQVSVAHGNLSFSKHPIVVGHYEGDNIYSAEKQLDHHMDGKLTARHLLGLYPGKTNTVEVILSHRQKPGGAIIVGLGRAGELTAQKLSDTYTKGLLEYALKYVEFINKKDGWNSEESLPVEFATLLVGTSEGGLSVSDSTGAILNAVLMANRALSHITEKYNVQITKVQFLELYKDRAIQAYKALSVANNPVGFELEKEVKKLDGGRWRIAYEEPKDWWNRLQVRSGRGNALIFSTSSDRARSEESKLSLQRRNIDYFVEEAVDSPGWDQSLASALFELLIPNRLKSYSRDMRNVVLVVDQETARYPWELIYDRRTGHPNPIVTEIGMIRQLSTLSFREQVIDVQNHKSLVIGEPSNTPSNFAPLPGAKAEAELVTQKLKSYKFEVTSVIERDSVPIMTSLLSDNYRILHLAGHGVYQYDRKEDEKTEDGEDNKITGMVLSNGVFLTAVEISQMIETPELIFVNCCYLGLIDNKRRFPRNKFAASLSQELINMGARAVVVAGWAVDDAAALTFAENFYEQMLSGCAFGEAVKKARKETFILHGNRTNTWGAYQCYGDPAYKLVTLDNDQDDNDYYKYADIEEPLMDIRNIGADARTSSARDIESMKKELDHIVDSVKNHHANWLNDSVLNEALGQAYGELDEFESAISYYEKGLKNNKAGASLRSAEQLANLRVRWAAESVLKKGQDLKTVKGDIEKSISELEQLNNLFEETFERLNLLGSSYKRLALISNTVEDRIEAINRMGDYYERALSKKKSDRFYPLTNQFLSEVLIYFFDREKDLEDKPDLSNIIDELSSDPELVANDGDEKFWVATGRLDYKLIQCILGGTLEKEIKSFEDEYKKIWTRYGSLRQFKSILDHLEFIIKMLEIKKSKKPNSKKTFILAQRDALEKILENLKNTLEI